VKVTRKKKVLSKMVREGTSKSKAATTVSQLLTDARATPRVSVKERKASKKAQEASRKESVEKTAALYKVQQASARERRLLKKRQAGGEEQPDVPSEREDGEASEKNSVKEEEEDSTPSSHPSPTPEGSEDDETKRQQEEEQDANDLAELKLLQEREESAHRAREKLALHLAEKAAKRSASKPKRKEIEERSASPSSDIDSDDEFDDTAKRLRAKKRRKQEEEKTLQLQLTIQNLTTVVEEMKQNSAHQLRGAQQGSADGQMFISSVVVPRVVGVDTQQMGQAITKIRSYVTSSRISRDGRNRLFERAFLELTVRMYVNSSDRRKVESLADLLDLDDVPFFKILLDMFDDDHHANAGNGADVLARQVEKYSLPNNITMDMALRKVFRQFSTDYDLLNEREKIIFKQKCAAPFLALMKTTAASNPAWKSLHEFTLRFANSRTNKESALRDSGRDVEAGSVVTGATDSEGVGSAVMKPKSEPNRNETDSELLEGFTGVLSKNKLHIDISDRSDVEILLQLVIHISSKAKDKCEQLAKLGVQAGGHESRRHDDQRREKERASAAAERDRVNRLRSQQNSDVKPSPDICKNADACTVCGNAGHNGKPCFKEKWVFAYVEFFNEITFEFQRARLEFLVIEQMHDIIVGNNAIREHSLLRACPGYIENQGFVPPPVQASASPPTSSCCSLCEIAPRGTSCAALNCARKPQSCGLSDGPSRAPKAPSPLPDGLRAVPHGETTTVLPENATRYRVVTSSSGHTELAQIYEKEELLDYEPDDDDIPDSTAPWQEKLKGGVEGYELPESSSYAGSESLQREAQRIVEDRKTVFSRLLREQPAKIEPLQLVVNYEKWLALTRDGRPRQTTVARSDEMKRQVGQMMDWNVIQDSQEANVSHVHLCKKPHSDELRFTIDYRNVNETLDSMGWPLPNITAMLQRLGAKRPKFFAVLDLTKGYYQAPLAVNSRKFTAFVTPNGTYEWTRVPMGLKNAPAYFQKAIQFEVLRELVGIACEIYIDDIIIFGSTEEEYLQNLAKVLDRLKEHALLVHPGKCKFNLASVEYVGHMISGEGLHFSREKLQKVADFPKPRTQKELKGFLGLANYFRDHVEHHSMQTTVLEQLARNYEPRKPVAWTEETEAAFEKIKMAINECPQLLHGR
jgi:hypothetical protein